MPRNKFLTITLFAATACAMLTAPFAYAQQDATDSSSSAQVRKAQRKAERKARRTEKNAELKLVEQEQSQPARGKTNVPQSLRDAQYKVPAAKPGSIP